MSFSYNSSDVNMPGDAVFSGSPNNYKAILETNKKLLNYEHWYVTKKAQFEVHSGLKSPKALHINMGE